MKKILFIAISLFMFGCAAGFDSSVPMTDFRIIEDPNPDRVQFGERWVRVEGFSDLREGEQLFTINAKRKVMPDDGVSRYVTSAFEDVLAMNDFRLSQMKGPIIRGEILDWHAKLSTGFPTSEEVATASVRIMVVDDTGKNRFSAVYNGSSSLKHPFLTESKAKKVLSEAMQVALESVLMDPSFIQLVDEVRQGM